MTRTNTYGFAPSGCPTAWRSTRKPAPLRARLAAVWPQVAAAAWLAALLGVVAPGLSGCDSGGETHSPSRATAKVDRPRFVATIHPAVAILREIVEGRADVVQILPSGASPHTYEPRPSDVRAVSDAAALFYVARELDEWAAHLPAKRRIALIDFVPPDSRLDMGEFHHDPGEEHPVETDVDTHTDGSPGGEADHSQESHGDGGGLDPHFWMDPLAVKAILPGLVEALTELDPEGRAVYRDNAKRFAVELDDLDRRLGEILSPSRGASVVLHHPSIRYLLNRYGLRLLRAIETSPGKEPSPRYIQDLVNDMKADGVKAVFNEPQLASRPVEVIGEAAGVPVRLLDPLGGEPGRETYSELLVFNAKALAEGTR